MRQILFVGAAAGSLLSATVHAQIAAASAQPPQPAQSTTDKSASAKSGTDNVEEVVVTGVRASLQNAIQTKRDADTVVDAISAEDIDKFPTEDVAESLQRVTGVQITRLRGEAQGVTIRGLPTAFTLVQLNGHSINTAFGDSYGTVSPGRSFDFTILPSEFVSKVEVYKEPTADMEEGGLAGTVIARTARPLDIGKRKLAGAIEGADDSHRNQWAPRASAFYSDVFADGLLGVALGAAYTKRLSETDEQNLLRYRRQTEPGNGLDLNGDGVINNGKGGTTLDSTRYAILDQSFHTIYREDQKRTTFMGTLQARPNEHLDLIAEGFYGKLDLFAPRLTDLLRLSFRSNPLVPETIVPGSVTLQQRPGNSSSVGDNGNPIQMLQTAELTGVDERADGRTEDRHGTMKSAAFSTVYTTDTLKVTGRVGISGSHQVVSAPLLENTRSADIAYTMNANPDLASYHFSPADNIARFNPATFTLLGFNGPWGERLKDNQTDWTVDAIDQVHWGWVPAIRFGARYAITGAYGSNQQILVTPAQLKPLWGGDAPNLFLRLVQPSSGYFLSAAGNTSGLFHQSWLASDPYGFINTYGAARIQSLGTLTNDPTGITNVHEQDSAMYFRADIDALEGKLSGNVGVRVVRTQQQSVGVAPDLTQITFYPFAGSVTRVPASAPIEINRSYTDVLPSLNLKYDLTDSFLVRLAASRTMSRPTLTQISPTVSASTNSQTVTANNPRLDPFRSNNYDLSGEWYFAKGGLLSATLFYKELVSLIVPLNTPMPLTITQVNADGSTQRLQQTWTYASLTNGSGIDLSGIELSYQQNFDFLPRPLDGLGLLTNYTYLQSHGLQPLSGASRNNYTASIYYEKGRFGGSIAYTYRGKYYVSTEGVTQDQKFEQPFATLDANITVKLFEGLSMVFEGTNLLRDTNRERYVPIDLPADYIDAGRRVLIGLRGSF